MSLGYTTAHATVIFISSFIFKKTMKKFLVVLLVLLVFVLAIPLFKDRFLDNQFLQTNQTENQNEAISKQYQTKENSQGEVTVEVTPISLSVEKNVEFKITLNTHSVSLEKNLKNMVLVSRTKKRLYSSQKLTQLPRKN